VLLLSLPSPRRVGILVAGLANGLYVLVQAEEGGDGFGDAADALYTTYKILLLGDFDDGEFAFGDMQIQASVADPHFPTPFLSLSLSLSASPHIPPVCTPK